MDEGENGLNILVCYGIHGRKEEKRSRGRRGWIIQKFYPLDSAKRRNFVSDGVWKGQREERKGDEGSWNDRGEAAIF